MLNIKLISIIFIFGFITCKNQDSVSQKEYKQKLDFPEDKAITSIFQDSNDTYWFGTNGNGVFCYDGNQLKQYSEKDGLCNNDLIDIQEDHQGNIYFDTHNCVSKFDGKNFIKLELSSIPYPVNEWKLEANDLWFRMGFNQSGPCRYDGEFLHRLEFPDTDRVKEFKKQNPEAGFSSKAFYEFYEDLSGRLWFGTASAGIYMFDGTSIKWMYEDHLSTTPSGGNFGIRSIIEDKEGYFWICNNNYRFQIGPQSKIETDGSGLRYQKIDGIKVKNSKEENPYFVATCKDQNNNLWFATFGGGIFYFDGKTLIHYDLANVNNPDIRSIFVDKQNAVWIGSQSSGVFKLKGDKFTKVKFE